MTACTVEQCPKSAAYGDGGRRGYCSQHYQRVQKGLPLQAKVYRPGRVGRRVSLEIAHRNARGDKQCTSCARWLPEAAFGCHGTSSDRLKPQCSGCEISRKHGMSSDLDYLDLLAQQGGVCAICRRPSRDGKRLSIDHDRRHCPGPRSCGACIRGLLCFGCNVGIGKLGDTAAALNIALQYLQAADVRLESLAE